MPRRASVAGFVAILSLLLAPGADRAAAGGGCHGPDAAERTEGPATVVRMDVCSFAPTVVRVPAGTTVRFLNTAVNHHAVVGLGNTWGSPTLAPGAEVSVRFDDAGIHPYACPLHPGMVGAVVVGESSAAAGASNQAATASPHGGVSTAGARAGTDPPAIELVSAAIGLAGGAILGVGAMAAARRRRAATQPPAIVPTEG